MDRRSFVDPHMHLWHPRETPRAVTPLVRALGFSPRLVDSVARRVFPRDAVAFFGTPEHLTRPYLPATFDADRDHHPVDGVVHIEAGWEGKGLLGPVGETRWLAQLEAVGACRIDGIVAHVDLALGAAAADEVLGAHLDASDRVCGVRDTLTWHPSRSIFDGASGPRRMNDPRWRRGFERLRGHGLRFDATCYDRQLDDLHALASAYPDQPIVLCHLGTPIAVGGPFGDLGRTSRERESIRRRWQQSMARLAECGNVLVKLSGLAMPACGFGWERRAGDPSLGEVCDSFGPLITFAIDTFGVDRCMFASNYPIDKASLSYRRLFDAYLAITSDQSPEDRARLFRDNARGFYGLPPTVP